MGLCIDGSREQGQVFGTIESHVVIQSDSPYKGGTFKFTLSLPQNFPFKPPTVRSTNL